MKTPISEVKMMDCMEGMKQFPDKFFDLAIVDPPYGIGINMNMGRRKGSSDKGSSDKVGIVRKGDVCNFRPRKIIIKAPQSQICGAKNKLSHDIRK